MKDKKPLIYFIIVLIVAIICGVFIWFISKKEIKRTEIPKEKTVEEILKDLTAPEGVIPRKVPPSVIKDLSAPEETPQFSEEVLKNLTAPK